MRRILTDLAGAILIFLRSILGGYGYRIPSHVAVRRVRGGSRLRRWAGALPNDNLKCITVCRVDLVVPDEVPALQQMEQTAMRLTQDQKIKVRRRGNINRLWVYGGEKVRGFAA